MPHSDRPTTAATRKRKAKKPNGRSRSYSGTKHSTLRYFCTARSCRLVHPKRSPGGPDKRTRSAASRGKREGWRRDLLHGEEATAGRDWAASGCELAVRRGRWRLDAWLEWAAKTLVRGGEGVTPRTPAGELLALDTAVPLATGYAGTTQRHARVGASVAREIAEVRWDRLRRDAFVVFPVVHFLAFVWRVVGAGEMPRCIHVGKTKL
ncbi:hypothetical protein VUR80DRAFT_5871 [Thermomyces stellatus]